jgi:hypothetical protein
MDQKKLERERVQKHNEQLYEDSCRRKQKRFPDTEIKTERPGAFSDVKEGQSLEYFDALLEEEYCVEERHKGLRINMAEHENNKFLRVPTRSKDLKHLGSSWSAAYMQDNHEIIPKGHETALTAK